MADILVMNQDNGADPWHWKTGMVVDVFPDGKLGPGTQQHPAFWIIRAPNISVEEVREILMLLEQQLGPEEVDPIIGVYRPPVGRRRDAFDTVKIPQSILNQLNANREYTTVADATQVANWITRKWPDNDGPQGRAAAMFAPVTLTARKTKEVTMTLWQKIKGFVTTLVARVKALLNG